MTRPVRPGTTGRSAVRSLVALVCCIVLSACGTDPSPSPAPASQAPAAVASATPIPSPTARPTATPVPATPVPVVFDPNDWGRVAVPAFSDRFGTMNMLAVATSGEQVVAVGRGPTGAVVWTSGADRPWHRAPDIPSFTDGRMDDVVALATGFAAVGAHDGEPAAWTSSDGETWTPATVEAPAPDPNIDGGSVMQHVTRGPGGLAAIGTGSDSVTGPAVWTSPDGLSWAIAVDPMPGISTGNDVGVTGDIGVTPDGQFMIVGSANGKDDSSAVAWRSSDARTWTSVTDITGTWLRGFVSWRGGIVAVGSRSNEDLGVTVPAIWVMKPDGGWSRIKGVPGAAGTNRDVSLVAITATDDRLIAVGPSPKGVLGVWISTDARTWTLADSPGLAGPEGEFEPADVATTSQGLVVVGDFPNHDSSFTWSASVWTDPAPGQPAGPTPVTAAHPCPAAAVTLVDVAEMTPEERFACFGRHDLTLRGYLGGFLDGGMTAFPPTPGWLADDTSCCRPLLPLAGRPQDIVFLQVAFEPGGPRQSKIPDLAGVAVTGHFDDPRATTCREEDVPKARSIKACRSRFVITSLKRIDQP